MSPRTAIYPGSFDPITNGHVAIANKGLQLFDKVVLAVLCNTSKNPTFSPEERVALITASLGNEPRLEVDVFEGLTVTYARKRGAVAIIRGLRGVADFDFELQLCNMNRHLAPEMVTVYLMAEEKHSYISSGVIKEVAYLGGDIRGLVPPPVEEHLMRHYGRRP